MGKLSCIVVMTLLSMLLSGCGSGEDKTVINYCKAIDAGRVDEAVSYLSKDARQALESAGGKPVLAAAGAPFKQHKGINKINIVRKKVAGDRANVEFVYNFNDGSKFGDSFPLVKEDGKWKISK